MTFPQMSIVIVVSGIFCTVLQYLSTCKYTQGQRKYHLGGKPPKNTTCGQQSFAVTIHHCYVY
jgi:hypothetical protein